MTKDEAFKRLQNEYFEYPLGYVQISKIRELIKDIYKDCNNRNSPYKIPAPNISDIHNKKLKK